MFKSLCLSLAVSLVALQVGSSARRLTDIEASATYGGSLKAQAWLVGYECSNEPSVCQGANVTCPGFANPDCPSEHRQYFPSNPTKFCTSTNPNSECRNIEGGIGEACVAWQGCENLNGVCTVTQPVYYTVGKCESRAIGF